MPNDFFADRRRSVLLLVVVLMMTLSVVAWWFGDDNASRFAAAAMGRIGLVLGALWLAWPSLRRPAQWLPAGVSVIGVVALMVLAAQPRLIFAVLPAVGTLMALTVAVKTFRGRG
ncbi:hypothetical protein [Novipirellula artificiosorum]|uniref:Uncharacterized protein n=1 Tax=Novipirellula artificiosorum TaxID=2528016 RepID=A0A5C6E2H5_9BACT|nr:hypothetical protein [Novipirellula artificiosorum]TWU41811.1 hypothetical protein Poly41_01030 [Novipirellula artificiosorum]